MRARVRFFAAGFSLVFYGFVASSPVRAETLSDPSLSSPVFVTRDEAGIVSIATRTETDMAFGMAACGSTAVSMPVRRSWR